MKSKSPYSAPVVCVIKKNGSLHLCIDYSLLNKKTVPDRHPLLIIHDLIDPLGDTNGSVFMTSRKLTIRDL